VSVPPQPTLYDGELVLRPWTPDDLDAARLRGDQEIEHWFGFPPGVVLGEDLRQAIEQQQRGYSDSRRVVSFLVEHKGQVAGTAEVRQRGDGNGELSCVMFPDHRGQGLATRAVRLLIQYAFDELGLHRVVTHAEPHNRTSLGIAFRVGLRREGIVRAAQEWRGERRDYVQLARLVTDDGLRGSMTAYNRGTPPEQSWGRILDSAEAEYRRAIALMGSVSGAAR